MPDDAQTLATAVLQPTSGTLATAVLQLAALSAAQFARVMPGAVSREQHSWLVVGSDSREPSLAVEMPCLCMQQVAAECDSGLLYFGMTGDQFDYAWGCALAGTSAQAESALPIFDQAFAGDDHALASGKWFLDSGAKRNYVVNAGPGFHTLSPEHQPRIGTAGEAVLFGVAVSGHIATNGCAVTSACSCACSRLDAKPCLPGCTL